MKNIDLRSLSFLELQNLIVDLGFPKYRAEQIFSWLHQKGVLSAEEMANIPKALKESLFAAASFYNLEIIKNVQSQVDETQKFLFKLHDDYLIESVLMSYSYGNSACISTQAGCRMGCSFCASTIDGLERNLSAGEMLMQAYMMQNKSGEKIKSLVLMGSGEPFDNYENVIKFIRLLNDERGLNIGQRHITLSTCGIIEKIYSLAEEDLQITLAVSLHAPNDDIRNEIMPISKANPMDKLLDACKYYSDKTKRRITFEYALISGVNDSSDNAYELSKKLKNMLCHINLIPVNDVKERNYKKSSASAVEEFSNILSSRGVQTTVRRRLGSDIDAACGQLRKGYLNK